MIFNTDSNKVIAAISYLDQRIQEAKAGSSIPYRAYHDIFFFADVVHLNKFGRPVLYDNWQAYTTGPLGNTLGDLIGCYEEYDWDNLSKSDKDEIERAFDLYLSYLGPRSSLNSIVCTHPAYMNAMALGTSTIITVEDMLSKRRSDEERREILENLYLTHGVK